MPWKLFRNDMDHFAFEVFLVDNMLRPCEAERHKAHEIGVDELCSQRTIDKATSGEAPPLAGAPAKG